MARFNVLAPDLSWFQEQRLRWISETLYVFGVINREQIEKKFDVSPQIASADISKFQALFPGLMTYDKTLKRYIANSGHAFYRTRRLPHVAS